MCCLRTWLSSHGQEWECCSGQELIAGGPYPGQGVWAYGSCTDYAFFNLGSCAAVTSSGLKGVVACSRLSKFTAGLSQTGLRNQFTGVDDEVWVVVESIAPIACNQGGTYLYALPEPSWRDRLIPESDHVVVWLALGHCSSLACMPWTQRTCMSGRPSVRLCTCQLMESCTDQYTTVCTCRQGGPCVIGNCWTRHWHADLQSLHCAKLMQDLHICVEAASTERLQTR